MKLSTGYGWLLGLPTGDYQLVGTFLLFDELAFAASELGVVVVVGGASLGVLAWLARGELQAASFASGQAGASEGVVLVVVDQVPAQHDHLPGRRHDRDLDAAPGPDPLVE